MLTIIFLFIVALILLSEAVEGKVADGKKGESKAPETPAPLSGIPDTPNPPEGEKGKIGLKEDDLVLVPKLPTIGEDNGPSALTRPEKLQELLPFKPRPKPEK